MIDIIIYFKYLKYIIYLKKADYMLKNINMTVEMKYLY